MWENAYFPTGNAIDTFQAKKSARDHTRDVPKYVQGQSSFIVEESGQLCDGIKHTHMYNMYYSMCPGLP